MGYLDANKLETPQNSSQVKITSNASINLQKSKAYKHNYKAHEYLVCKKVSRFQIFRLLDILRLLVEVPVLYQCFTSELLS